MRFVITAPFADWNADFHYASPDQPAIIDIPDEEIPNQNWIPLDAKAKSALDLLAARIREEKGLVIIHDIPTAEELAGIRLPQPIKINKRVWVDPTKVLPVGLQPVTKDSKDAGTMSSMLRRKREEVRPSDQEPN